MAFAKTDPRAALPPIDAPPATRLVPAQTYHFGKTEPEELDGLRNWYARGKSFVIVYTEAQAGAGITRRGETDEHLVILYDDCEVLVRAGTETQRISGRKLLFLPPGDSFVEVVRGGRIVQASTTRSAPDLVAKSACDPLTAADPNVAEYAPAGAPHDGYRIRSYDLTSDPVPGAFAAVWRCSSFLVLRGFWTKAPRDITRLSPHTHVNFQQSNLFMEGQFRANLRWPWVADKREWRPDQELEFTAPAVLITPAQTVHTIEARGEVLNH